jgi:hypothetical protein
MKPTNSQAALVLFTTGIGPAEASVSANVATAKAGDDGEGHRR